MSEEEELVPSMSALGWLIVEIIERMQEQGWDVDDICMALDLPTEYHLYHMLEWAERERSEMLSELSE